MFNIAIDSKLRGCDVVGLKVDDVAPSGYAAGRIMCIDASITASGHSRRSAPAFDRSTPRSGHLAAMRQLKR